MFEMSEDARAKQLAKYSDMVPEPLNRQFSHRVSKDEAISRKEERLKMRATLFPEGNGENIFTLILTQIYSAWVLNTNKVLSHTKKHTYLYIFFFCFLHSLLFVLIAKKQDELQSNLDKQAVTGPPAAKKKVPHCATCQKPKKGHSKAKCRPK